jgi:hypothetical protein
LTAAWKGFDDVKQVHIDFSRRAAADTRNKL